MTTRSQRLGAALEALAEPSRPLMVALAVLGTLPLFQLGFQEFAEPHVEASLGAVDHLCAWFLSLIALGDRLPCFIPG